MPARAAEKPKVHLSEESWINQRCREVTSVPRRSLPLRSGCGAIRYGLSCEPVNPDYPDASLVSAWCLCLFREKPGVSDDFPIVTNPPRVLLPAEDTLQELPHLPRVITRLMIAVDERKAKPRRPCQAESGIRPALRLGEFSGLPGGDDVTQGGMDPILLSWPLGERWTFRAGPQVTPGVGFVQRSIDRDNRCSRLNGGHSVHRSIRPKRFPPQWSRLSSPAPPARSR